MDSMVLIFITTTFFMTVLACVAIIFTNKVDSQRVKYSKKPENERGVGEYTDHTWVDYTKTKKHFSTVIGFVTPPLKITRTGDYIVYWKNGESEIMRFDAGESTDDIDCIFGPVELKFPKDDTHR